MKEPGSDIKETIRKRRSIYPSSYSTENVPEEIIDDILESANWAPTHKRTEPWRFVVFSGEGLKMLARKQAEVYEKGAKRLGNYNPTIHEQLKKKPLKASHVIAILLKRDSEQRIPEVEEIASVAAAVQNMHLTATAHGIGAYWGTGGITYLEEAKPLFSLGENDRLMGFFFLGIPKSDWPEGSRSSPIEEKVERVYKDE